VEVVMTTQTRTSVAVPRPQRADARRNFEAVLAAAKDSFAVNGPDASLEEIARQAGVGIATLYRNFPTRADLLGAVYFDEIEALATTAEDVGDLEPWDALVVWLRRFIGYMATKRALIDGINRDSDLFRASRGALYSSVEPLLERAQASGDVRPEITSSDLLLLFSGLLSVTYTDEEQRSRVLDLGLAGIRI
jgi:AcrR family transcriptional regulator